MPLDARSRLRPGRAIPLGATWDGSGTNFALYSENATHVELCLFDERGEELRVPVLQRTELVWHVYLEGIGPGQRYGYRVDGAWKPKRGLRFNPHVVLLDPYAKALSGKEDWRRGGFAYDLAHPERDLVRVSRDQRAAPLGVVVDPTFDWGDDTPPDTPLRKSLIYEAHVKGMTARHPGVPPELRGTYAGLATDPILTHLRELGVTAIELLPVHAFTDDPLLLERGLRNYWGYNSIAFFAPDVRYRSGDALASEVTQFKKMVKALHAEGIEVILDVVYNHTAEGNHLGPTLSLKGIDNSTYYRLVPENERYYFDYTSTGNSLNVRHPQTLRLIMDSLRYWVEEMHVDGFRFDLAAALARSLHDVDRLSSFFTVIHQDPVLSRVKLIAEPWDVGEGGYQVGRFPVGWAEWNDKYRDTIRAFWRGDGGRAADLGSRLTGSSDLYQRAGRAPSASVNHVTAHDGFTLRDLVSYDTKHNESNGEDNQDGIDNGSWSCGVEGDTDDPGVLALRRRQVRNLMATLLFSLGTPMICGGDEIGRTQRGNNNAYCHDDETGWLDWELDDEKKKLLVFARRVSRLRRSHPLLQRASFFRGREVRGAGVPDLVWLRHDGEPMSDVDWNNRHTSSLGMFAAGSGLDPVDEEGRTQNDDDLLLLLNASEVDLDFVLPALTERGRAVPWELLLDTSDDAAIEHVAADATTRLAAHSLKLFSRRAVGAGGLDTVRGAPVSTYRLQLQRGFGFREATEILDYLEALGVGAVYTSPYFRAQRGSTHGYDVVDHSALDERLGNEAEYRAFTDAMRARALRHVVDFVPNHVGVGTVENRWWIDLLENGPSSAYAEWFDVEWDAPDAAPGAQRRVLLPILGRQFGEEVEEARIGVLRDGGALFVTYQDKRLPASPQSYAIVIERAIGALAAEGAPSGEGASEGVAELESILAEVRNLPVALDFSARIGRAREKEIIKRRLGAICSAHAGVAEAIDEAMSAIAQSPDRLERFLGQQHYRLSYWRVATDEINYRRFFDFDELAAIRMEDGDVFAAAHSRLFELVAEGRITGLRLDHTDGLYDPHAYFLALQEGARAEGAGPIFAVAEKILEEGEELTHAWPISGTTGYDFLAAANALFVDAKAEGKLSSLYTAFADAPSRYRQVAQQAKRDVMNGSFASEVHVLSHALKRLAERNRRTRDFTLASLVRVIRETIASFAVYRTYVRPDGSRGARDEENIRRAIAIARRKNPTIEPSTFDFLQSILLLQDKSDESVRFAMRFQQLTGPIMAKGVEDTALYRFVRLTSLNEVGCDPGRFGISIDAFHAHNASILAGWPLSMTTTSTHDTKRSEDVRARISVLSEIPDDWATLVKEVHARATRHAGTCDGDPAPSPNDAYLFYQSVVGAFPFAGISDDFVDRIASYMTKAAHEAKVETSWTNPSAQYDRALDGFVRGVLHDVELLERIATFARRVAPYGAANSLATLALRLASPGVPDVYQGAELWNLSLVDPDNRRPVDFERRRRLLSRLRSNGETTPDFAASLVREFADGGIKLHVTTVGLRLRREDPTLFLEAAYEPIVGPSEHVVAFQRRLREKRLVCVVPRFSAKLTRGEKSWALGDVWGDVTLKLPSGGRFRNAFTGETLEGDELPMKRVLRVFPVAWLEEIP